MMYAPERTGQKRPDKNLDDISRALGKHDNDVNSLREEVSELKKIVAWLSNKTIRTGDNEKSLDATHNTWYRIAQTNLPQATGLYRFSWESDSYRGDVVLSILYEVSGTEPVVNMISSSYEAK